MDQSHDGGVHLTGMDSSSLSFASHTGDLTLTVWPDNPLGEHQRYAYRVEDTTTRRVLEGRDLFTGAGAAGMRNRLPTGVSRGCEHQDASTTSAWPH